MGVGHAPHRRRAHRGPGHRYLIQHSAGSGKTNSIAWTAHQLSTLHRPDGAKAFDSVIVVTDRTVLDSQLQDAIKQIDAKSGVVVAIDAAGSGSKSERLAAALTAKAPIIVVTIQTFGFVAEKLGTLPDHSFAIIADEAHSSQTGTTASKVKQVLSPDEAADLDDGGEVDMEALLALQMESRANATNISYFAYTATPKAKTLELFGRKDADGKPRPFHLYTMQQAIEEGFILDVLKNYTPYKVAFKLAHAGQEYDADAPLVDRSAAVKQLMNWVKLHDFNISQKVRIIVEHFRSNVAWRLDGRAKAMVVTGSRMEAVRYKRAFDAYLAETGYPDVRALVAFSGEVDDPESGPGPHTETTMNPGLKGRSFAAGVRHRRVPGDARGQQVSNRIRPALASGDVCRQEAVGRHRRADPVTPQPHCDRQGLHERARLRQRPRGDSRVVRAVLPRCTPERRERPERGR